MIVLRKFKNSDLENIKELFENQNPDIFEVKFDETIYLALTDEKLIGAIQLEQDNEIWTLDYIFICEEWRNKKIGDGLLRAMLDKLDKNKVQKLIFNGKNPYLLKKGFKENKDNILEINISDFFEKQSSCCGNNNEI